MFNSYFIVCAGFRYICIERTDCIIKSTRMETYNYIPTIAVSQSVESNNVIINNLEERKNWICPSLGRTVADMTTVNAYHSFCIGIRQSIGRTFAVVWSLLYLVLFCSRRASVSIKSHFAQRSLSSSFVILSNMILSGLCVEECVEFGRISVQCSRQPN